ncbi:MAG TPA: hypothetical protein VK922_15960, partial [Gemmatimonadaceae bacterium]|nr:hypothetical protein [Gemmatimonadaceae bacterium]
MLLACAACARPEPGAAGAQAEERRLPDPRVILSAQLSHGIGASPFDSPLLQDSLAATIAVRARRCVAQALLRQMVDATPGDKVLDQLVSDGVLVARGDRLCTTFPILIGPDREAYASVAQAIAHDLRVELGAEFASLLGMVEARGWRDWQYHFLWSQLFDSQYAWVEMTQRNLVPPLHQLIAWSIHPDHPFRSGTNYYPDNELRDHWVMVSWRAGGSNTAGILGNVWSLAYDAAVHDSSLSAPDLARLSRAGLVDDRGRLELPVLQASDPLVERLRLLSVRYVELLEERLPLDSLTVLTGVDPRHTFAMAYHDVSWDIVEALVL